MITLVRQKMLALAKKGFFTSATMEVTSRCNLSCKYCYIAPDSTDLRTPEILHTIDRLDDAGALPLTLTGGEPFMHPDILEILTHAFSKSFFTVFILTNGTCITDEHLAILTRYRRQIGAIRISFFSHIPEIHDAFTGHCGSFSAAYSTAHRLKQAGFRINTLTNIVPENSDSFKQTLDFFRDQGFRAFYGITKIAPTESLSDYCSTATSRSFFKSFFSKLPVSQIAGMADHYRERIRKKDSSIHLCEHMFSTIAVKSDGTLVPCLSFRKEAIANVKEDKRPLQQIMRESSLIKKLRTKKRKDIAECSTCELVNCCVICPAIVSENTVSTNEITMQHCNYSKVFYEKHCS